MNRSFWIWIRKHPLRSILIAGLALRTLASVYSPGYLMHDDHFLVVEAGASWAVGEDYNNWMPWSQKKQGIVTPAPHQANLTYPGIISGYFRACKCIGLSDPMNQMVLLRWIHGLYSLLVVYFSYRIALKIGGNRPAIWTGVALATFGFLPMLSVRQLVEMVCIPPLLWSAWLVIRSERKTWKTWVLSGVGIGLATSLRYQCGVFGLGWVVALFIHEQQWQKATLNSTLMGTAAACTFALGQAQDIFIWGEPFAQLRAYVNYNATHAAGYPQGFWHQYVWVVLGLLVPPFSFAWAFGTIREIKRLAVLVIPPIAFFAFHSCYPNRQERFILPSIPFIITAGSLGWDAFASHSRYWQRQPRLHDTIVAIGVTLSVILGVGLCFVQPKESRIEAMYSLLNQGDLENFLIVQTDYGALPPQFYSGTWKKYWISDLSTDVADHRKVMCNSPSDTFPNYIVFSGDRHLGEGIERYKSIYSTLTYVKQLPPSKWDRLLAALNPHNYAERSLIYRIDPKIECASE